MIRIRTLSLAAASLAAALAAPGARTAGAADVCSLAPLPAFRDGIQLIATATADTLPASAGGMDYTLERGTRERAIYGQVVRVERVGGTGAEDFPAGAERAVLVPWSYDAGCRRTLWTGSAVWSEPGQRGLYWSVLRPRGQWVDGLPTFDVGDPFQAPYPGGLSMDLEPDSMLGIEQVFDLVERLPLYSEYEADAEAAVRPLMEWARGNPELASRFPASDLVYYAEADLRYRRLQRIDPPLGGTWRFTVSVDGDAPRTWYARSRSAPTTEWSPWLRGDEDHRPPMGSPIRAYTLLWAAATALEMLPAECCPERESRREGYISVMAEPDSVRGGVQFWSGDVELALLWAALRPDSVMARIARADDERYARLSRAGEPVEVLARFVLHPDGAATMEQTSELDDGRRIVIRGERVSRVTIPSR